MIPPKAIKVGCRVRLKDRLGWWTVTVIRGKRIHCCQCIYAASNDATHVSYEIETTNKRKKV